MKAAPEALCLRSSLFCSHKCIFRDGATCIPMSIMWQHIACMHIDIKDDTQRLGFKQSGGILLLQSLPSFWGQIGSPAFFPTFPPQLPFNQLMQMLHHHIYLYLQYLSKVCTHFFIELNEEMCSNIWLVLCIYQSGCMPVDPSLHPHLFS